MTVYLGIDIGTSTSKGVAVNERGLILAECQVRHDVSRPFPGWAEQDAERVWWGDFLTIARELVRRSGRDSFGCLAVSGIGPCVLPTDETGHPLRPALLYGIDTRAAEEIEEITSELTLEEIVRVCGSPLTTQAVGPKLRWLAKHEPGVARRTKMLFSCSSYLVFKLTGQYQLDHTTASHFLPLYSLLESRWETRWVDRMGVDLQLPRLAWPGTVVGRVSQRAASETGLPAGLPVTAGTMDSCAEAVSVGVRDLGDTMFMYGTTMVLLTVVAENLSCQQLWPMNGVARGSWFLAGAVTSAGALTDWVTGLTGNDVARLSAEANHVPPGSRGLLVMPYFGGERTPFSDPLARGGILGLRLDHTGADIFRACLEGVAFAARQNLEFFPQASYGGPTYAVGGGVRLETWPQIVSDVTGVSQVLRRNSIGASLGNAVLAAEAVGLTVDINTWNPVKGVVAPQTGAQEYYASRYPLLREFYRSTRGVIEAL